MKLEIDIPSILYNDAKENRCYISVGKMEIAWKAIADGKPLEQEPTTKNDLGVDCISRAEMLKYQQYLHGKMSNEENHKLWEFIKQLPPVTPQEPKTGHWTEEFNDLEGEVRFICSSCGKYQLFGTDFCYHCGAKMVETQESDGKERLVKK